MGKTFCIHANPKLAHQTEFADYLRLGFLRHGIKATVSSDAFQTADVHVVLGPHFAKQACVGKPTILLDRGWWGNEKVDVSLSWMSPEGNHTIRDNCPNDRPKPELQPWKTSEQKALFLLDYGATADPALFNDLTRYKVTVRPHPASRPPLTGLHDEFTHNDFAVGYKTSALVSAVIAGLPVVCFDSGNVVQPVANDSFCLVRPNRQQWLNNLSYHHYSGGEIADGTAWAFLHQDFLNVP